MGKSGLNKKLVWSIALLAGLALSFGVIRSAGRRPSPRASGVAKSDNSPSSLPHVILWAWERPEKLDFIDPNKVGVAFLAQTLYLRADKVVARPRLQPLSVPNATAVIAVARIESDRSDKPALSRVQLEMAATEIAALARLPNVVAVQIDFDAMTSERVFYSGLLTKVREAMPPGIALSITALASWCKGDNWLSDLPVDEAVPMLFRMGVDRTQIMSDLSAGESFRAPLCRQSQGVSTDEPLPPLPSVQRIYVFNPDPWSPNSVKSVLEKFRQ